MYRKACNFPGKDGFCAPRRQAQGNEVAKGVHHGDDAQSGKKEYQGMAEAKVVVDCADQHDEQNQGEQQTCARRNNEDPALGEDDRKLLGATDAKQPFPEQLQWAHQGSGVAWIMAAMSSGRA